MNGEGCFFEREIRGDQFFVLTENSLYHSDFGLLWEDADFLSVDQSLI
ncbi:MAG: hypothetical protein KDA53_18480 [Hyphomonas sp.]|nr:hypothetical protein [Hyphomonas sp.]